MIRRWIVQVRPGGYRSSELVLDIEPPTAPAAPTVKLEKPDGEAYTKPHLTWPAVPGVDGYLVARSISGGPRGITGGPHFSYKIGTPEWWDQSHGDGSPFSLHAAGEYRYWVAAYNDGGLGSWSEASTPLAWDGRGLPVQVYPAPAATSAIDPPDHILYACGQNGVFGFDPASRGQVKYRIQNGCVDVASTPGGIVALCDQVIVRLNGDLVATSSQLGRARACVADGDEILWCAGQQQDIIEACDTDTGQLGRSPVYDPLRNGHPTGLALAGSWLFSCANGTQALVTIDVSDWQDPRIVSSLKTPRLGEGPLDVALDWPFAYVVHDIGVLVKYDVSRPTYPVPVGAVGYPSVPNSYLYSCRQLALLPGIAYLCRDGAVTAIDTLDMRQLVVLQGDILAGAQGIAARDGKVYVAADQRIVVLDAGLHLVDVIEEPFLQGVRRCRFL